MFVTDADVRDKRDVSDIAEIKFDLDDENNITISEKKIKSGYSINVTNGKNFNINIGTDSEQTETYDISDNEDDDSSKNTIVETVNTGDTILSVLAKSLLLGFVGALLVSIGCILFKRRR